jgi:hypothetical protein
MQEKELKQLGSYLLSAIDMEEDIASSVYRDYTDRKNWPADIDEAAYEEIQSLLRILLNDTVRHKKIFSELKEKIADL